MATLSLRRRAEKRIPVRMFVKLSVPDSGRFEITQTIDISRHGARVVTKRTWEPNQHLLLRALRGNFTSYARVAHCESLSDNSFALGLQLLNPTGTWPTRDLLPAHP